MVVKMRKWSSWLAMPTRKYKVKVKLVKLEFGFSNGCNEEREVEKKEKYMAVRVKWKGEPKFGLVPFHRTLKRRIDFSMEKIVKKGGIVSIEWDDEFENMCSFTIVSGGDQKFDPWNISFSIVSGEKMESKSKLGVIGRAYLNIAEMASLAESEVERKLPMNLQFGGISLEANLLVLLNFVEIRDSKGVAQNLVQLNEKIREGEVKLNNSVERHRFFTVDTENAVETTLIDEIGLSTSSENQLESVKKMGFFSWKRRHFFKSSMLKREPLNKKTSSCNNDNYNGIDTDLQSSSSSMVDSVTKAIEEGGWESKELISRDGETKLKTDVFFASFDQCSNKVAGESACTTLVTVIVHWLQLNRDAMPTRSEFDNLIVEGSHEWRKLCENDAYMNDFPNKHFDLETILCADVRPISISHNDSFVGFFSPEKFESLKGSMSFDEIWSDINKMNGDHNQRIYIVSWNDHFFVLKMEVDAYYIIDTLGARLYEGCNQAYILRFNNSSMMYGNTLQEDSDKVETSEAKKTNQNGDKQLICSGKDCCKEFIKRFLAAIPLQELEEKEENGAVSYYSLHHRLQIELNFSYLLSSSLTSSPFSFSSNCASTCSTDESCCI